jgi:peptidoglycan/xylan/chitin deacetylase (PgdA/CDA1 family)
MSDAVVRPPHGVVVLAYHQVGAPVAGSVNLPVSLFDEQMAWLAESAAARPVVSLEVAVERLAMADGAAGKTDDLVVITFDDGTADFVDHAVPILEKYRLPVTLYLATSFVEQGSSFWGDGTILSWSALRDATATGLVDVGSHTDTHLLLDRADAVTAASDLDRSVELIQERLGVTARHFAYPKALAPSATADALVRDRFTSAAVAGGRPNRFGATDVWRLSRTPIVVADAMTWFERKARGGLRLEGALREKLDRRRYAEAAR